MLTSIMTPERALWRGQAKSISAANDIGEFSILPGHANFISLVNGKVKIKSEDNQEHSFDINQGVLSCRQDKVDIFIGFSISGPGSPRPSAPSKSSASS